MNRELAKCLGQRPDVEVTILLPQFSELEKEEANRCNVRLTTPEPMPGFDPKTGLSFPREDLDIDVVIGHGQRLGGPAQIIAKQRKCKRVHVVHTLPVKSLQCLRNTTKRYQEAGRSTERK